MEIFFGAFTSEWLQRRAALLHELSLGGRRRSTAEEELRKRMKALAELGAAGGGGSGGSGTAPKMRKAAARTAHHAATKASAAARPMQVRLTAVAQGSQPAVVKMASYGGGARVGAMLNYVSRGGDLSVENENGERLRSREDLAGIRSDWDHLFQNRAESRDIGGFTVEIAATAFATDDQMHEFVRSSLTSGFGDRRFAYAVERNADGSLTAQGVVVLRSGQGERLTGDEKAAGIIQSRFDSSAAASEAAAQFSFQGYGNGVEYGANKLRDLVDRRGGDVRDDRGQPVADEKSAGDLVQKEWRGDLHSRKGRDVMHLIMSARAGTDVAAFEGAVRDFLADQFAGHSYVFAMHDPANDPKEAGEGGKRPHVHAHAIITMKSESGDRIETTPAVFRQWRAAMAEKARGHGIAMEMTDRREFASPPAFTRTQVRPVSHEGRTEHVGTSDSAQARYDAKRSGRRILATSDRSRQYTIMAQESWQKIALVSGDRQTVAYAAQHRDYLESGLSTAQTETSATVIHADFGSTFRANMITLRDMILEGEELRGTLRVDFEAYEKKVETALFKLERSVGPEDRADFDEVASLARDFVNQKRELVDLYEQRKEALAEQSGEEPRSEPRDPVNDEWDAAVVQHGEAVVEDGNEVMIEIEHNREGLDRVEAGDLPADSKEAFQYGLNQAVERAAQLAVEGNSYIRGLAEQDQDRQRAIERAEKEAEQGHEGAAAEEKESSEGVVKAVQAVVAERINRLDARLSDRDSPHFISEDSYVTRNEAYAERQFLEHMHEQLDTLEPGDILDLSRTETNYGYDPEEAASDQMSGIEYVPAIERDREEHEGHVHSVASQLGQLSAYGVTVDTSFNVEEPKARDHAAEWAALAAEYPDEFSLPDKQHDPGQQDAERQPNEELTSTIDPGNRPQDRIQNDNEAAPRAGDTTRTDPAQQHIPRLEELEREELEKRERDRDDRER